jgi:hypothetical protein
MFLFLGNVIEQVSQQQALVIVRQLPHLIEFITSNMMVIENYGDKTTC